MPVSTFNKEKLYTNPKMIELPDEKARNDFTKSLDALNLSVLKTHCMGGLGATMCQVLPAYHPISSIPLQADGCYCSLTKE